LPKNYFILKLFLNCSFVVFRWLFFDREISIAGPLTYRCSTS